MKHLIDKINRLHELHSEADRRQHNHNKEADKYRNYTDSEGNVSYLWHSTEAKKYDTLTRYLFIRLRKAIRQLNSEMPEDKINWQFDIDGKIVDLCNEKQAAKLAQKYPTANVKMLDWLTSELIDEAQADCVFNVEPKERAEI